MTFYATSVVLGAGRIAQGNSINMKTRSIKCSGITHGFALLAGLALPALLLLAQSASAQYTSEDISSTVTAGPIVNVKQIASSSAGAKGSAGAEVQANRFPRLHPPMTNTGDVFDQVPATPLALFGQSGSRHCELRLQRCDALPQYQQ